MKQRVVVDTGPLVAAIDRDDQWHLPTIQLMQRIAPPMVTCEAVLAETWFLLRHQPDGWQKIEKWLKQDILVIDLSLRDKSRLFRTLALIHQYHDLPMSMADASLITMLEERAHSAIFTWDHHFQVYRLHGREPVTLIR